MGSKTEGFSDSTGPKTKFSHDSVNDVVSLPKSSARDNEQHAAGETNNFISSNSSHGSFSENAESKESIRNSDVFVASEDVEMITQLSTGDIVVEDQLPTDPHCISDQRSLTNKFEDPAYLKVHEDSILFASGTSNANKFVSCNNGIADKKIPCNSALASGLAPVVYGKEAYFQTEGGCRDSNLDAEQRHDNMSTQTSGNEDTFQKLPPCTILSTESSSPKLDLFGNPSSDLDVSGSSLKIQGNSAIGMSLSCKSHVKDLEEPSCSRLHEFSPKCSREHSNHLMEEEASKKIPPNLEDITENDIVNQAAEAINSLEQIEAIGKVNVSLTSYDSQETSLHSQSLDDGDESDIVEHDVKVCDICGDAGREDLLAICSRCSDGAEHTYCMRDMLDKVPAGDWLCEDCKLDEQVKNRKQDKFCAVDEKEKYQIFGDVTVANSNICVKMDIKDSDIEETSAKACVKRQSDNVEAGLATKRQALEPILGSPKSSSFSISSSLSRDCSSKYPDKGKLKPGHQSSSSTLSINDTVEAVRSLTGSKLQAPRGSLIKSNSFNSSNAKPKVKLFDKVGLQKQKSSREYGSLNMKEGAVRLMGKSSSFKSANLGCSSTCESKTKIMSPKAPHVQDLKGSKHAEDKNLFGRKNSFRSERTLVSSATTSSVSTTEVDQKPVPHGEILPFSSVGNNHESKVMPTDSKLSSLSKPTNLAARRGSEIPASLGETKRLSSLVEAPLTNGTSSCVEPKANQTSCKNDHSLNPVERLKDTSANLMRQNIPASERVPCQKCKEMGHAAEMCTVDSTHTPAFDASVGKNSREVMDGGNKLKAAIEAAMLKKPGICRKNRAPDRSDELSRLHTNLNCEVASQEQVSNLSNARNVLSANEMYEAKLIPQNSSFDPCNQTTINTVKQLLKLSTESAELKRGGEIGDGNPTMAYLASQASAAMAVLLKMSAVPVDEYIWKGNFEIRKSGKLPQFIDGVQAHLSTCVSSKVFEVMNKFPQKVLFNEVPRLSTWPIQFQKRGVKEENIALYFFARDIESYEKSYKNLVENMIKSDVALQGNFDGIELLIFPSNQLPEKSQRWNMLFYLWGVFRVKKVNSLQDGSGSPKFCTSRNIPTAITSLPDRNRLLGLKDKDDSVGGQTRDVAKSFDAPSTMELPCFSSETNGNPQIKVSSIDPRSQYERVNLDRQDCRINSISLSKSQTSSMLPFTEKISLEKEKHAGGADHLLDCKLARKLDDASSSIGSSQMTLLPPPPPPPLSFERGQLKRSSFVEVDENDDTQDVEEKIKRSPQVRLEWGLKEEEGTKTASCDLTMDKVNHHPRLLHRHDVDAPNLELALGGGAAAAAQEERKLPFSVDDNLRKEEERVNNASSSASSSASLSLSLSFPFSFPDDKQQQTTAEPPPPPPLPSSERRHTNTNTNTTPLLLFGGFPDI